MINAIGNVISQIDSLVWGWWMIILLLGTHIFMTIRTGVIQRKIGTAIRLSVTKDTGAEGEVSQFGALTTALASTIGTGNIIGVGTAIALGDPGAVLWCWLTGVFGIARGLFSNESGMGSAPIAAAAAQTRNPVRQALVSSTGTFWDTVVVCLMTGLVLVTSIMKNPSIDMGNITDGGVLTTLAFQQIPVLGPVILVVGIISFAYSTVLGWAYYGERCVEYFSGKKGLIPYRILYVLVAAIAPVISLNLVWTVADILNALMAIPNLIAVLLLSNVIVSETKKYIHDLDARDDTPIEIIDK